jgi:hypothetical protein
LSEPPGTNEFNIVAHTFRSDATTSHVHLGHKLHNTELESIYCVDPDTASIMSGVEFAAHLESQSAWCETQRVHDSTALGTCALLFKQLRQVGYTRAVRWFGLGRHNKPLKFGARQGQFESRFSGVCRIAPSAYVAFRPKLTDAIKVAPSRVQCLHRRHTLCGFTCTPQTEDLIK